MKFFLTLGGILLTFLFLTAWPMAQAQNSLYPVRPGFPIKVGGFVRAAPVVADIDNNGQNELLVANYRGELFAWDATGNLRSGFPFNAGGIIPGEIAVADLNGDSKLEIAVGVRTELPGLAGQVVIWQANGLPLPGWPQTVDLFDLNDTSAVNTVVLADIDRDNDLEVMAGTDNNILGTSVPPGTDVPNVYAWQHTGQLVVGAWPAEDGPSIKGTLAVGNLKGDSRAEIVLGRDYQFLFAYDNQGNLLPGWPVETLLPPAGSPQNNPRIAHKRAMPSLADLDGDGQFELIVAGVRKQPGANDAFNTDVLVLQADGTRRPGWETPAGGAGFLGADAEMDQAPTLADLNQDGQLDIVVPTQDGWIRAYKANKELLWQFNFAQGQHIYSSEPVIGDVDNDGRLEILFGTYDPANGTAGPVGLWILEHNGAVKAGAPLVVGAPGIVAAPTLADLDRDGKLDIIATSRTGMLYAWNTGAPVQPSSLPWPVARQNNQRTAFVDPLGLSGSSKTVSKPIAQQGEILSYKVLLERTGPPLTSSLRLTDVIPSGLRYIPNSLNATHGTPDDDQAPQLKWSGTLPPTNRVEITYQVEVTETLPALAVNSALIDAGDLGQLTLQRSVLLNPLKVYLPLISKDD